MDELTHGGKRVRVSFNPNENSDVKRIKAETANLIDFVEVNKHKDPRLIALAQTHYEDAAMWAVKAATTENK